MSEDEVIEVEPLEVDEGTQGDSDLESILSSGFTSLDTRVRNGVFEGGRRYQAFAEGRYPLPNDDPEVEREKIKHKLLYTVCNFKFYYAPISDRVQKILDLGTGTGLWAIDVGEKFPAARVIGVDLSDIQSPWMPVNVEFRVDDIEKDWADILSDADFIHLRAILIALKDPMEVLRKAYRNIKPGGWIEIHEIEPRARCDDNTIPEGYALSTIHNAMGAVRVDGYNWNMDLPRRLPQILGEIGFTDIRLVRKKLPIGAWHGSPVQKMIGDVFVDLVKDFVAALLVKFNDLNLTEEEAIELKEQVRRDFENKDIHAYMLWIGVCAQKPE